MTDPAIPILGQYIHTNRQDGPVYSSSIEIGTPSKGGAVKVYFDPADPADAEKRIREAFRLREVARELHDRQGATA